MRRSKNEGRKLKVTNPLPSRRKRNKAIDEAAERLARIFVAQLEGEKKGK